MYCSVVWEIVVTKCYAKILAATFSCMQIMSASLKNDWLWSYMSFLVLYIPRGLICPFIVLLGKIFLPLHLLAKIGQISVRHVILYSSVAIVK
jgi:hypothetical protein